MQENKEKQNYSNSGFNDESEYSDDETKRKTKGINRFLIKSSISDSLGNIKNNKSSSDNDVQKAKSTELIEEANNDNDIITNVIRTNTEGKNSINSEVEENIKIISHPDNNGLYENLVPTDDNNLFSFKDKFSKLSTTEDIFRDTIKISMNRTNRFNTSKLARLFTYEESGQNNNYILKRKKFGMAKNKNIITYILNLYIFSEFTNFNKLEEDSRFNLYFLPISEDKYAPNVESVLQRLKIKDDNGEQFTSFINGLNELLNDKEYKEIKNKNKKYKIYLYLSTIILFFLISGIIFCSYFFIYNKEIFPNYKYYIIISAGIITLFLIIIFILQLIKIFKMYLYILYNKFNYMLVNYNRFNDYIEGWNKNFFEKNKIRASIPISLNYIMFNLDPYQDIEIKHLDMKWFIQKLYKDKKAMANDKEFIKYYIKVRTTLVEGKNSYESV